MSAVAQVFVILGGVAGLFTLQTFWLARYLDRIEKRLDRIETAVLRDHGERIARLEERLTR